MKYIYVGTEQKYIYETQELQRIDTAYFGSMKKAIKYYEYQGYNFFDVGVRCKFLTHMKFKNEERTVFVSIERHIVR